MPILALKPRISTTWLKVIGIKLNLEVLLNAINRLKH